MSAEVFNTLASAAAFIPCVWFVVGYWYVTGGKWRKSEVGIFLMSFMTIMGTLFLLGIIGTWVEGGWLLPAAIVVFLLLVTQMWWPLRLLWLAQRERRQK